jgi:hypothetical protein
MVMPIKNADKKDAVDKSIGKKLISEMTPKQLIKALKDITSELKRRRKR